MSTVKATNYFISVEDYLEGESVSDIRHEYIEGNVYAMSGASLNHQRISSNIIRKLVPSSLSYL